METTQGVKTKWEIDKAHSEIQFKVKHLVISTVTGSFEKFDALLETEAEDFNDAEVHFTADIESINTGVADRDAHLKSNDFFNAAKYPQLRYESSAFRMKGSHGSLIGNLTIRDITLPVELSIYFGGKIKDQYNQTKVGFEVTGKINRKDFGLAWNAVTDAGGVVVAEEVKLIGNVQFTQIK